MVSVMPVKMCKVRLVGPKSKIKSVIEALEQYGGVEIKKISSNKFVFENFSDHNKIVDDLIRVESLEKILPKPKSGLQKVFSEKEVKSFLKSREFKDIEQEIIVKNREIEELEKELEVLSDSEKRVKVFSRFELSFPKIFTSTLKLYAGVCSVNSAEKIKQELQKMEFTNFVAKRLSKDKMVFLIASSKQNEGSVDQLSNHGFERIIVPKIESTPQNEIKKIEAQKKKIVKKIENARSELQKISNENYARIAAVKEYLEIQKQKSVAAQNFGATKHAFVMEAYLPEKNFEEFEKFVKNKFNDKIVVKKFSSKELMQRHEEPPTLLEHSSKLKPFVFMTKFVSVPKSNEIDPTLIFMLFFPFFYAMMVGDVIYGLISFFLAYFIQSKVSEDNILKPVSKIWMWSAIPTIVFGFVFDEFAGMSHGHWVEKLFGVHGFSLYRGIERIHNIETIMVATILLGVFTMALGFLLGFWNAMIHGNKKHGVAKLGWFGIVSMGTIIVSSVMFNAYPEELLFLAIGVMIVSILVVVKNEGVIALMEIPSALGNVLSFARILAVGLVGAVIAIILNDLAFPSLDNGLFLIITLPLFVVGHVFNAFLAMFESLIQGARLNYVEFYSKFYEGGGKEFQPFKFFRKYVKEQ